MAIIENLKATTHLKTREEGQEKLAGLLFLCTEAVVKALEGTGKEISGAM